MATQQTDRTGGPAAVATQTDRTSSPAAAIVTDRQQGLVATVAMKAPCLVASTAELTLAGEQTIDGVAVTAGKRVLVKDQSDARQNGIWLVATGNWVRAADFFGSEGVRKGTRVFVTDGAANVGTEFAVTTADPITVGTTAISFAVSSAVQAAGVVAAGLPGAIALGTDAAFADADYLVARQTSTGTLIKRTWANVKNLIRAALGAMVAGSADKAAPVDTDLLLLADSEAGGATRQLSIANLFAAKVASATQFIANAAGKLLTTSGVWGAAAHVNLGAALTGTVALDFSTFLNGYGTLTGNITLGATSGLKAGQTGTLTFTQSGGPWTLSVNSTYYGTNNGSGITLGAGRNKLSYEVQENGKVFLALAGKAIA